MTSPHPAGGEVRMAGAAPEARRRIAGQPLDAAATARARDMGWR